LTFKFDTMFRSCLYSTNISEHASLDNYISETVQFHRNNTKQKTSWLCDTYSTLDGSYSLDNDPQVRSLLNTFDNNLKFVCSKFYGYNNPKVSERHSWINLAMPGEYQEFHLHERTDFSLVYYVQVGENTGNIIFRDTAEKRMQNLRTSNYVEANFTNWTHIPAKHDLLIFRSHLEHMVSQNKSDHPRISISANYNLEEQ